MGGGGGGCLFHLTGPPPPKHAGIFGTPLDTDNRERSAAAAMCVGVKTLFSSADAPSAISDILTTSYAENLHARSTLKVPDLSLPCTSARAGGGCMFFAVAALGRRGRRRLGRRGNAFVLNTHCCCVKIILGVRESHVVTASL